MHSRRDTSGLVLCKYFKQGHCMRGSSCHFSHDLRAENTCRYFLQGTCAYGDRCRYDHVRPSAPLSISSNYNAGSSGSSNNSSSSAPTASSKASFIPSVPSTAPSPWKANKTTSSQSPPSNNSPSSSGDNSLPPRVQLNGPDAPLCPYGVHNGSCSVPDCSYLHGDMCEVCQLMILHPFNEQLRQEHKALCEQQFEEDLHYSFAIEASKDKVCGICLEIVLDKDPPSERKFGILDCCDHIFCLKCIMSWRQTGPEMSREAIKSCPECRRTAKFIMKSDYWCDTPDAKKVLVEKWMTNAKKKPCKFWKSEGYCRFADRCFFSHDGTPGQRRRRLQNDRGIFPDDGHQLDFVSLILEATRRHGNINPSSLLFSLSDDDSDDISFEAADDYISSFASERSGHVFLPEDLDLEGEEDDSDGTVTSGDPDWTTDDEADHWIPTVYPTNAQSQGAGSSAAANSSTTNASSLNQPD